MQAEIIYSNRKTLCLKVRRDGSVQVLAPYGCTRTQISEFVQKHSAWLAKHKASVTERNRRLENADTESLRSAAREYIPQRAEYYARLMGVRYTGIKITSAKTRFGSCSAKNSLCFSLYLMAYDRRAVDSVIVHELAHIIVKNHSPAFYKVVEKTMPDYKQRTKLLKNGIL